MKLQKCHSLFIYFHFNSCVINNKKKYKCLIRSQLNMETSTMECLKQQQKLINFRRFKFVSFWVHLIIVVSKRQIIKELFNLTFGTRDV